MMQGNTGGEITLTKIALPKEQAQKLTSLQRKHYFTLTSMLRDIDVLRHGLLYAGNNKKDSKLAEAEFVGVSLVFLKIVIGHIWSMWEYIRKNKLNDEIKSEALLNLHTSLLKYFDRQKPAHKLIEFIRNKFAFHYEHYADIDLYIDNVFEETGDVEIWSADCDKGSDLFSSSSSMMLNIVLAKMKEFGYQGDDEALLGQLLDMVIQASFTLREYVFHLLTEHILKGLEFQEKEKEVIVPPAVSDIKFPFFISKAGKASGGL